ncbi:hypothetical protein RFI_30859, partial [Reticulomyxa filosa]
HVLKALEQYARESVRLSRSGHRECGVSESNNELLLKFGGFEADDVKKLGLIKSDKNTETSNANGNSTVVSGKHNTNKLWWEKAYGNIFNPLLLEDIVAFMNDEGIQETMQKIRGWELVNAQWFLMKVHSLFDEHYIPDFNDYVLTLLFFFLKKKGVNQ